METAVFVPAVMSVGLLFSVASLLGDAFRWGSRHRRRRRVRIEAEAVARTTIDPAVDPSLDAGASRLELSHVLWAVALLGAATYVAIGASANYLRTGGYLADIAWLLALSLVLSAALGFVGGVAAVAAYRRGVARDPALSAHLPPLVGDPVEEGLPSPVSAVRMWLSMGAVLLLSLLVGSSHRITGQIDEPLADWFARQDWLDALRFLDPLGRTEVAFVLAALVGVAALRCRVIAVAFPAAVLLGGLASVVLKAIIDRPRPAGSNLAGAIDSFPSGHAIQIVLLAGLVPLALAVLTDRRWVIAPTMVVLGLGAVGAVVHRLRTEDHWPLDALAGALIGITIVSLVVWATEHRAWHARCRGCVWSHEPRPLRHRRGAFTMSRSTAHLIRLAGRVWSLVAVVALGVLTVTVGVPTNPADARLGSAYETPIILGLLALFTLGALVALRFTAVGATVMAFAGAGLGAFSSVEYRPAVTFGLTVALLVPAFLLWLAWQRRQPWGRITALAVVTSLLLGTSYAGASRLYDIYFGPSHPDSVAASVPVDEVRWAWFGGLTPTSVTVAARLTGGADEARLVTVDEAGVERRSPAVEPDEYDAVRLVATDLAPGRDHDWWVEVDGVADTGRGRGTFSTPVDGAMSLRFAVAACARTGSNGAVFDRIRAQDPDLYLQLGDLHYRNIEDPSLTAFRAGIGGVVTQPGQAALYRDVPIAYVWDDHDFGPNDADSTSATAPVVQQVFRELVPHHPLPAGPTGPIHRAFTMGRVRVIMTDTRSVRTADTMLGEEQLAWLIDELRIASRDHALVIWASPTPWIGEAYEGADTWAGWPDERRTIADAIAGAGIDNLVMVAGDAHMVAIDDGTNSDYSVAGGAGFPVLQAAALDRPGSVKGGPYTEGTFPGGGQFGVVDITDDGGDEIGVTLRGMTWDGTELASLERTFAVDPG
ncbi:MAG: alkaline phosphatase D family protein [Actinomycetota bacterium]|nr:alkaline phosphatase D family protein [Actinomycetota bacterium]